MRLSTLIHSIAIAGAGLFATASAQPLEADTAPVTGTLDNKSEPRRVGKECRTRLSPKLSNISRRGPGENCTTLKP